MTVTSAAILAAVKRYIYFPIYFKLPILSSEL